MNFVQEPKKKDPVIVAGKDVSEVDVDYFLIPVNIRDHEGPLFTSFPIENRLIPQGMSVSPMYYIFILYIITIYNIASPWNFCLSAPSSLSLELLTCTVDSDILLLQSKLTTMNYFPHTVKTGLEAILSGQIFFFM